MTQSAKDQFAPTLRRGLLKGEVRMKKFVIILSVVVLGAYLAGCGKKTETLESMQEPMPIDSLTAMNAESLASTPDPKVAPTTQNFVPAQTVTESPKLEPLPPQGPYKPTAKEIQTALKNAGFYTGTVDGKIGSKSKKAIEEFQKANGLTADGKVGPKTWAALGPYLNKSLKP